MLESETKSVAAREIARMTQPQCLSWLSIPWLLPEKKEETVTEASDKWNPWVR